MKNILKTLAVLLLLGSASAFAQKVTIEGNITDAKGVGLDLANVVAINLLTQELDGFGITDPKGHYRIVVKANSNYSLKVSFIGYTPKEYNVTTAEVDLVKDVVLEPQAENLDEVEITYEMPVTIKGDTIVYNSDSFTTGSEKKLEDVLKKLPGVAINDDGEVEVEGKKVTKLMVEGQEFFDGDTKMGSKNIPAKALDKIEVLRNYSDVNQLSGVTNNQDNVALNIRLKEGQDHFWFGELTAGRGLDERYILHPKVFYYSKKFSVNLITDVNNIGSLPFTTRDYFNFTGGMRMRSSNTGTNFSVSSGGLGISLMQNNRAKSIDTKFGAFNFSANPSSALTLGGFVIYSYTGTQLDSHTDRSYILSGLTESTQTNIDQESTLGLAKFNFSYKPNNDLQWDYDLLYKSSEQNEDRSVLSIANVTDNIVELKEQKPVSVTQNTNLYYTLDEKNIIAAKAQFLHQNENPFYRAIKEQQPFMAILPLSASSLFNINQERDVQTDKFDANLDYYIVTGDNSNIKLNAGTLQSRQNFNSTIFQILDNSTPVDFNAADLNNQVSYSFSDLYAGLYYKVKLGKITLNPGVLAHQYKMDDVQLGRSNENTLTNLVPDIFVNIALKKSESIRFNYRVNRSFTDISNLATGYVFSNYNSMFRGNRDLESALYHSLSLNYFSFNMFNFQNIHANISYNKQLNAIKNNTTIQGINRVSSVINSNLEDESFNSSFNYQRTFGKIKWSSSARFSASKFNNLVNERFRVSKSITQNYRASLGTQFYNAPNIEMGYSFTKNKYDNGGLQNTFITDSPFARFDAQFLKNFILTIDYDFYNYRNTDGTNENRYEFLESTLSYQKEDSKWEFSLVGTNLLESGTRSQDSFNDLFNSTTAYVVQPRYVVFQIKFEL